MTINTTENHHPDKINQPKITVPTPRRVHQKIHGIEPIENPLTNKMRQYDAVTQQIVSMKNWTIAYEKDFGYKPNINLAEALKLKNQIKKELVVLLGNELQKVKHIKGFGIISLAGILAYAHPSRFPSLRKFLFYCGYTMASRKLKNYNRKIKPIMYSLITSLTRNKDLKYYQLYLNFKKYDEEKTPNVTKMHHHMVAMNKVATQVLKEVYKIWQPNLHERLRSERNINSNDNCTCVQFHSVHETKVVKEIVG